MLGPHSLIALSDLAEIPRRESWWLRGEDTCLINSGKKDWLGWLLRGEATRVGYTLGKRVTYIF